MSLTPRLSRVALALLLAGCAAGNAETPVRHVESAGLPAIPPVSDAEFATKVHELLLAPPGSAERAHLLTGVESRQMERAAILFRSHEPGRGLVAVIGGLYLLRTGELGPETLGASAQGALRDAVKELAVRGDEGRARALYDMLLRLSPPEARPDIQGHLDAIAAWMKDELKAGPATVATGAIESATVARSLLEPTAAAKEDAEKATLDWIGAAMDLQVRFKRDRVRPAREEGGEAWRAFQSGNDVLAQIFLRDGDSAGAARALARSPLGEARSREGGHDRGAELAHALDAMGSRPSASDWLNVLHALSPSPHDREQEEDEMMEDRELLRAATFGIALEAYRLDPTQPEAAALVAAVLQDLGLAEASPAVIVEATQAHGDGRTVSGALTIVVRAMSLELSANDFEAVRRTYAAAAPLLAIADRVHQQEPTRELQPSAARLRAMMGGIELEQGALPAARALLSASVAEERSGSVLLSLAQIDRHDEDWKGALEELRAAREAPDAMRDPALRGEILLLTSDLLRDAGDVNGARPPLVDALVALIRGRTDGPPEQRARVEQVLSRVLDRFGARDKAQQALERAFEATPHDKRQIANTLGQVVARAFVRKDLLAARDGLSRAIASELSDDEIVYYALWVHLLEKQLKKPADRSPDGPASKVFASIPDDGHWVGKLAAYGAGKLPASELVGLARTKAEKTEAKFYEVMDARASHQPDPNDAGLRAVLKSDGVDLMEAVIARELLRSASGEGPLPLPPDVKLP
jgi:tetratricopeptide (TPR) repeat protein